MSKRRLRIENILKDSIDPIFVLDSQRRVVFFNQGCTEISGWSSDDVLGQTCLLATESDRTSLAALTGALAPPAEVFHGEPLAIAKYFVHRQTGHSIARMVHFYVLHDADEPLVLGLIQELPKLKPSIEPSVITQVHAELGALRQVLRQRYRLNSLIARSPSMRLVLDQIQVARHTISSVALIGEAGVGKEQVARAIHYESEQGAQAFVPIDCRHLPAQDLRQSLGRLIESDWKAMTPVSALHPGCIYLRNIESMPRELQQRLIDFFLTDVGRAFRKHVRFMVSSEGDLSHAVQSNELLDEFTHHCSAITIRIPTLRQRLDELRILAQHFLEEANRATPSHQVTAFANDVWNVFEEYTWPGNLDELRAVVFESHGLCPSSVVQTTHLPLRLRSGLDAQSMSPQAPRQFEPLESLLSRTEQQHIAAALQQAQGNKTVAAKLLGISRAALNARLATPIGSKNF